MAEKSPFDIGGPATYGAEAQATINASNAARGFGPSSNQVLQQEAPETLVAPKRDQFVDDASYQAAQSRFTSNGNWATSPEDFYTAGDKASVAKYGTPLPPNDPASMNGGRQAAGDLYIGRENWGKLQTQYTPYQLEQATKRDANGNISWKEGVDIASIPRTAPATPLKPPTPTAPVASDLVAGSNAPTSTLSVPDKNADLNIAQTQAAQQYLTGIDAALDNITKQQQAITEKEKAAAEANRGTAIDKIKGFFGSTSNQDTLAAAREKYKVDENFATLQDIRQKMASAADALNQGLIYEEGRPVRMAAMQGRTALLQKQGQATIGALKSVAEIVQGNLNFAKTYADDSVAALKQDNADQINAANTLLELYDSDLVRLSEDEKDQIDYRKQLLKDENDRLEKNKDQVFDLASKYPQSFTKAGVTFMDSPEQAMQKMLPFLSDYEKMDLEKQKLALTAAKTKGSGGGGSSSSFGGAITGNANIDEILAAGFSEGKTLDQIISDFGLIGKLSAKQLNLAQDFWSTRQKAKAESQYSISDLQNLGINPKDNPEYLSMTKQDVNNALASKVQSGEVSSEGVGSTIWKSIKGAVSSAYNWWNE